MELDKLIIRGAKENNLKNISLDIPKNKMVVMTGLSGSGKTSLAFDTIYAEGQRRYVESLSAYARQFLGGVEKPDVELIEGLSPAISIDQKTTSNNPRSTVGTVTEIYDYLRLLYARTGTPYCPNHNIPITGQTIKEMTDTVMALPDRTRLTIMAPLVTNRKGTFKDVFAKLMKDGPAMKWSKLISNLLSNAASAIFDMPPAEVFGDPDGFELELKQIKETLAVMKSLSISPVDIPGVPIRLLCLGVHFLPAFIARPLLVKAVGGGRGSKMPSFYIDLHAGRKESEVEFLNGAVVRYGSSTGVKTPVNRAYY